MSDRLEHPRLLDEDAPDPAHEGAVEVSIVVFKDDTKRVEVEEMLNGGAVDPFLFRADYKRGVITYFFTNKDTAFDFKIRYA